MWCFIAKSGELQLLKTKTVWKKELGIYRDDMHCVRQISQKYKQYHL